MQRRQALIAAFVTASVLGIGMLILQRWIADTRLTAMALVAIWFIVVAVGALIYGRTRPEVRAPMLGTIAAIAVATVAIGYWTGFRKTEVNEMVEMATVGVPAADRDAALAAAAEGEATVEMATSRDPEPDRPPKPLLLAEGEIVGQDGHSATGTASLIRQPDGMRVLTLTALDSDPGPDVDVYLSSTAAGIDDAIKLGDLKGSGGNQQYEVPADADLARNDSVVLWCVTFTTRIATAELG